MAPHHRNKRPTESHIFYVDRIREFRNYDRSLLRADALAGLTVSLISLPLAMAFTIASGIDPEYGLYSAIIAGATAAIFGGSELTITGPAGSLIGVLLGLVTAYGYQDVLLVGILAGAILVVAGLFKLGRFVQYVPLPVIIGFTGGIGVIILMSQLPESFGITGLPKHPYFHQKIGALLGGIDGLSSNAIAVTAMTLAAIEGGRRILPQAAAPIVGISVASLIAYFANMDVRTIEAAYGSIPQSFPALTVPEFTVDKVLTHIGAAATVAALISLETLLSATASDGMTGKRHNSNAELVGCGIANMVAPLFGGIPVCGTMSRTTLNARLGAETRVAAIFNALALLAVMLFFAPIVGQVPLPALAGLLIYVAIRMIDVKTYYRLLKHHHWTDFGMFAATLFLTVFINLSVGITCGLLTAVVSYVVRIKNGTTPDEASLGTAAEVRGQVTAVPVAGPLFFHTSRKVIDRASEADSTLALVIALTPGQPIDASGVAAIADMIQAHGTARPVFVSGVDDAQRAWFRDIGLDDILDDSHVFLDRAEAMAAAQVA